MDQTARLRLRLLIMVGLSAMGMGTARVDAGQALFGLGDLGGGLSTSRAWAVSLDGSTVVGESVTSHGTSGFRWTRESGITRLGGSVDDGGQSVAYGVSEDGSVIVGAVRSSSTGGNREAFRWSSETGIVGLGGRSDGSGESVAFGVSADGSVVVGTSVAPNDWGLQVPEAFRWDRSNGLVSLNAAPSLGSPNRSAAYGVSADGTVVAGRFTADGMVQDFVAGAWTTTGGWVEYQGPGWGDESGQATAVSADGAVIVGSALAPPYGLDHHGFRWERSGGANWLLNEDPDLNPPFTSTVAEAVSADGSIVVGTYRAAGLPLDASQMPELSANSRAFYWDATDGFRFLDDVLLERGVSFAGWTLLEAQGLSGSGNTITGTGINPDGRFEAWVVTFGEDVQGGPVQAVPEPSSLVAMAMGIVGLTFVVRRRTRMPGH